MILRDDATEAQVRAAGPLASTWLAANAGSGKTRVLTDRVARLLLSGAEPQRILCLTYTKAAASEMQNRLFRRLGGWAMLPDDALRAQLRDLGHDEALNDAALRHARTLFARAIETPGGLKIQTIHSFCASLLRRFPLEAAVSPGFTEMEERATALLREAIVRDMANGPDAVPLGLLADNLSDGFDTVCAEIVSHQALFAQPATAAQIWDWFGLPAGFSGEDLLAEVFLGDETRLLARLIPALQGGSVTDIKAAAALSAVTAQDLSTLAVLEDVFLTGASAKSPFCAKTETFPTKKTREGLGDMQPLLGAFMLRVEAARDRRLALSAARRTAVLHDFAQRFLARYAAAKQARGLLDFDDLIVKARDLLIDPGVAAWVLYRLDGGIDHILVDEAQDTSPTQWQVIELLTQELTAGQGARGDAARTIFVVGDKKQSIYSFQGADPREFDRMQAQFADRLAATNRPLQGAALIYSFRSAAAILNLVDTTFQGRDASGFPPDNRHRAFKTDMPGRVDLWPCVPVAETSAEADFTDPVDQLPDTHHSRVLARRIAHQIAGMIASDTALPEEVGTTGQYIMRPVRAGDFLILVQRRSTLFAEIIRACKEAGLPIAGADRLRVGGELAVRDLGALMAFLAVPEDSLSLATALRSPLFGWSEQALFDLAHKRQQRHLWAGLRDRAAEFPATMAILDDLRGQVDFLRPFDIIERILTRHDGRRRFLARLGPEAEDGINAFLAQALAYERGAIPSLTGFLQWMQTDDLQIKRQMDAAGDRIRVMTVHGAKGLEAPIVILPDTARRDIQHRGIVLAHEGRALWRVASDEMPARAIFAREAHVAAQRAERDRLLYVAMTRAEKWLIVAAAGALEKDGGDWYSTIARAMQHHNPADTETEFGTVQRVESGDWSGALQHGDVVNAPDPVELPALYRVPPPMAVPAPTPLSPSDLGGAKALPGEDGQDTDAALRRGAAVHRLLEHLPGHPPQDWPALAASLLVSELDPDEQADVLAEVTGVLQAPALASIFAPGSLCEVAISADLPGGRRIAGVIDRLILSDTTVVAVDFKTNAVLPDTAQETPEGLLRQMGAYAHGLRQIYPDRHITCALVWTRNATRMDLADELIAQALARAMANRADTAAAARGE